MVFLTLPQLRDLQQKNLCADTHRYNGVSVGPALSHRGLALTRARLRCLLPLNPSPATLARPLLLGPDARPDLRRTGAR